MSDCSNRLIHTSDAARIAGLPSVLRVYALARRGDLRIAGVDEKGGMLFRESSVLAAAARAAEDPECRTINGDNRVLPDGLLPCGCFLAPQNRFWPSGPDAMAPMFLCPDARALEGSARLAAMLALVAPDDPFFRRLAEITQSAFDVHLRPLADPPEASDAIGEAAPVHARGRP